MRYTITTPRLLFLLSVFVILTDVLLSATTLAASDGDRDDYDQRARVVRVSLLRGDVNLRRAGTERWERASLNLPLVEGDRLATGADARVEIQIDARNFVRLGEYATLDLITLRDEGIAFSLSEGTASVRLVRFDREREYFEIDAPQTTIAAERRGTYRLDVAHDGSVRVTVRDDGRARIYSATSGFTLRSGRTAELASNNSDEGDWELSAASSGDAWDRWVDERENYLAEHWRYDNRERYYDSTVLGAEELDAYGDWIKADNYGYVWRPHVTVINNYNNWSPYRYGHWSWCPPYGWAWIGDEAWGWAPYHYGRWVYYDNSWCWAPRGYYHYHHVSWWRPALVAFVYLPSAYGEQLAWYPLAYHQPDPRAIYYRQLNRLSPLRAEEIARLQRINPIYQRAVSTVAARDFGTLNGRAQPASLELARRAVNSEPVRGSLPIRPPNTNANGVINSPGALLNGTSANAAVGNRARVGLPARPTLSNSLRALPERPTGAATRTPGLPLDTELQRARIFNNREPRNTVPAAAGVNGARDQSNETRNTGAVARPARPARWPNAATSVESNADGDRNSVPAARPARPARPVRPDSESVRPNAPAASARPDRRETRPIENNDGGHTVRSPEVRRERPARPQPREDRPIAPPADVRERPAPEERRNAVPSAPPIQRSAPPRAQPEPRAERPAPPPQRVAPESRPAAPAEPRRAAPPRENNVPTARPARPQPRLREK